MASKLAPMSSLPVQFLLLTIAGWNDARPATGVYVAAAAPVLVVLGFERLYLYASGKRER